MKKLLLTSLSLAILSVVAIGITKTSATSNIADQPSWVSASGKVDYTKVPDTASIPYKCWSGKDIKLTGKIVKQKMLNQPKINSEEYKLGIEKSKELRNIPGTIAKDEKGAEIVNIDDSNPQVQQVMKKYEAKETPQCT